MRPQPPETKTGKRVAIVGSGPAGLAAAQQLARVGHDVHLYEKHAQAGGLLRYGIPDFKMEKYLVERRVEQMQAEGVTFHCNVHGDPYPQPDAAGVLSTPSLFIGTVERTYRAAVGLAGRTGPLDLAASAGFHHVVNSGHQAGRTVDRFEGRIQGTLGFSPGRSASMRQSPQPLTRDRVLHLIQRMKSSRVVVVGDIMLDRYLIGETERLSPEAPVPVVTVRERHAALGGAANVAANVVALGARCLLVGAVGDDVDGASIRQELAVARLEDRHVLTIAAGPPPPRPGSSPVPADRADR